MNATATISTPPHPSAAEEFEQFAPVIASPRVAGPGLLFLVGPWLLLVLLLVPPFALLLTLLVALALPFVAAALAVAVVASPYLLARAVHRRVAERRRMSEGRAPVTSRVARTGRATQQPGFAALVTPTTARRSR